LNCIKVDFAYYIMPLPFTQLRSLAFSLFGLVCIIVLSSSTESYIGKVGATQKPDHALEGCFCHHDQPDPNVGVGIMGPRILAPGQSAEYVIWVAKGNNKAGGFNVATYSGLLSTSDRYAKEENGELCHSEATAPLANADTIKWKFTYVAPSSQNTDTIYANGINVDSTLSTNNDHWNYAPKFPIIISSSTKISFPSYSSVPTSVMVFPNPAKDYVNITIGQLSNEQYSLSIQNTNGQTVKTLAEDNLPQAGQSEWRIPVQDLKSGHYLLVFSTHSSKIVKPLNILP
jgi:hypothetical protein